MRMPQSDQMVEGVYDMVNGQPNERTRAEVARAALLAAQYRAAQLAKKGQKHDNNRSNVR